MRDSSMMWWPTDRVVHGSFAGRLNTWCVWLACYCYLLWERSLTLCALNSRVSALLFNDNSRPRGPPHQALRHEDRPTPSTTTIRWPCCLSVVVLVYKSAGRLRCRPHLRTKWINPQLRWQLMKEINQPRFCYFIAIASRNFVVFLLACAIRVRIS